jgi:alpha-tubulin suppressor-like RCC1 family protein
MARPRDNADLLSGGKMIEIESGIDSGLTVINSEGRQLLKIKENGEIYQDHEVGLPDENGVILVSDSGGIRVNDYGLLEITENGGQTWYPCCSVPEAVEPTPVGECGVSPVTFQQAHDASLLISANGGRADLGSNTSTFINGRGKLFTCGGTAKAGYRGNPRQNYNEVAVPLKVYYDNNDCGFKDKFSEIDLTGTLPSDYEAAVVRCVGSYTSSGTESGMTMILTSDHEIWSIGYNKDGNRGVDYDSGTGSTQIWERESLNFDWKYIAPAWKCTYAIKTDGTLWETGRYNPRGVSKSSYKVFSKVGTDSDWKMICISDDGENAYALKNNGTLWSWGNYNSGALGRYTPNTSSGHAISQIGDDNDWIHVACGGAESTHHFVALKSDGTLWGFGQHGSGANYYGGSRNDSQPSALASGSGEKFSVNRTSPNEEPYIMQLGYEDNWVFCDASIGKTIALKCDGSLWATGLNGFFQLGVGGADRDAYGRTPTGGGLRKYADGGSRYNGFQGHLATISSLVEEITKRREWLGISAGFNHVLALDGQLILYGAGCNNTFFGIKSNENIYGTSMGFDVASQDRFIPCVYGLTDYTDVPQNVPPPTPPTPTPPSEPAKTRVLVAPNYACTYVSPGWQHRAKAGKWPAHIGPDPNSDCAKKAQAAAPNYKWV